MFFEAPELLKPIAPLRCDYCPNVFSGIDNADARAHLHDHMERKHPERLQAIA